MHVAEVNRSGVTILNVTTTSIMELLCFSLDDLFSQPSRKLLGASIMAKSGSRKALMGTGTHLQIPVLAVMGTHIAAIAGLVF